MSYNTKSIGGGNTLTVIISSQQNWDVQTVIADTLTARDTLFIGTTNVAVELAGKQDELNDTTDIVVNDILCSDLTAIDINAETLNVDTIDISTGNLTVLNTTTIKPLTPSTGIAFRDLTDNLIYSYDADSVDFSKNIAFGANNISGTGGLTAGTLTTNLITTDAVNSRIGILKAVPGYTLQVGGSIYGDALYSKLATTVGSNLTVIEDTTTENLTVNTLATFENVVINGGLTLSDIVLNSVIATTGTFNTANINNLVVDTNLLISDATNNRIGINTLTPAYDLDVYGEIHASGNLSTDSDLYSNNLTVSTLATFENVEVNVNLNSTAITTGAIAATEITASNAGISTLLSTQNIIVDTDLLYTHTSTRRVGINKTTADYTLDVNGIIRGDEIITGIVRGSGFVDIYSYTTKLARFNTSGLNMQSLPILGVADLSCTSLTNSGVASCTTLTCSNITCNTNLIKTNSINACVGFAMPSGSAESCIQVGGTRTTTPTMNGVHIGSHFTNAYGIDICSDAAQQSQLDFTVIGSDRKGSIRYSHSSNQMTISTNSNIQLTIDSNGDCDFGNNNITTSGDVACADIICTSILNAGTVSCTGLTCSSITNSGTASCTGLTCSSITNSGTASCTTLTCSNITCDTSLIKTDSINNFVGINVSSPESSLHIQGTRANTPSANGIHLGQGGATNSFGIDFCSATGTNSNIDFTVIGENRRGSFIYDNTAQSLAIHTNSTQQLIIDSSGNIDAGNNNFTTTGNISANLNSTKGQLITFMGEINSALVAASYAFSYGNGASTTSGFGMMVPCQVKLKKFCYGGNAAVGTAFTTSTVIVFRLYVDTVAQSVYAYCNFSNTTAGDITTRRFCNKFSSSASSQVDTSPSFTNTFGQNFSCYVHSTNANADNVKHRFSIICETIEDL